MTSLLAQLAAWKPFRAIVLGDYMLDQQLFGDAERLSADAPVPILHVRHRHDNPGGAANVCLDLIALRGQVTALGITGDDATGAALRQSLDAQRVDTSGLVADPSRPTTVKQNLIGLAQARHPQKMFRVDFESRESLSQETSDRLFEAFRRALAKGADVVCIEDYDKGVCTPGLCRRVIDACRAAGVPVLVDPARIEDYSKYAGATAITPNRTEAELATGQELHGEASPEQNARIARQLLEQLNLEAVVLTLDRHGALLLERSEGQPVAIPTIAREVYDVTGAGDMMLAAIAAARANNLAWPDAVRFGNAAAGLEVEVFGVVPIPLERVHNEILIREGQVNGKLRTLDQALVQVAALRRGGKKIVFTNGCFDILHSGHVSLLEQAAAEGDFLILGLNDDASVRRLKGEGRPVNTLEDRARVLGALACVGAIVPFAEDTPIRLIESLRPDVLVKGADYRKDQVVGGPLVESYGGRIALVELVQGKSTTETIAKIARRKS
ncbi:MAG: D-glycero-beta-D-manno-heptose 1-phosphate adenylyltransferase [Phycisphaeraceae bacterium]|nr:D-glycero-beta-D-manno-heptose 1-phosphate adenylyltransferase [Phycisphaeraceae bacterium]